MDVYYKPACITCKRVISEMERLKMDLQKRDIFKDALSESEIKKILRVAKIYPRELLRKKDKMYKELGLDSPKHADSQIIKYMAQYPGLIRRPIVSANGRVMIGKIDAEKIKSLQRE